ncbi:MAG: hypothetical protein K8R86_07210, partial [Bacteroidales bacterium]|nr:hypothetical protein [Bacteroidales bacterium]
LWHIKEKIQLTEMKLRIIKLLFLILPVVNLFSQDKFDFGLCRFDIVNYKKSNIEFTTTDSVAGIDLTCIDKKISKISDCFNNNLSFIKGQIIDTGSYFMFPDFSRETYRLPAYELLYKYYDNQIDQHFYFSIYLNKKSKIIGHQAFLKIKKFDCSLIDKEEALKIVEEKWINKKHGIYDRFGYDKIKRCFAWQLSRIIKGGHDGYFGEMQTFLINANNGKIIYNETEKLLLE